jgi:hypothetical protein
MLSPVTLAAAFGLAKLQEEYILSTRRSLRAPSPSYSYSKQLPWNAPGGSAAVQSAPFPGPRSSSGVAIQNCPLLR